MNYFATRRDQQPTSAPEDLTAYHKASWNALPGASRTLHALSSGAHHGLVTKSAIRTDDDDDDDAYFKVVPVTLAGNALFSV